MEGKSEAEKTEWKGVFDSPTWAEVQQRCLMVHSLKEERRKTRSKRSAARTQASAIGAAAGLGNPADEAGGGPAI